VKTNHHQQQRSAPTTGEVRQAIGRLLRERGHGKTICSSEAARAIDPVHWRAQMAAVRAEAFRTADAGEVVVLQRGRVVNGREARGPIRIARAAPSRP
jgi:Protein of unknown function (DUF3253)